jgi:lipopolysaccharide transport system permease protein
MGMAALILAGFMIGVILTPLGLLYSDVQQSIPIVAMFLMFLTPVLYPQPKSGLAATMAALNPLAPLVTVTRDWLTGTQPSQLPAFMAISICVFALLFLGWVVYRLSLPHIIARSGN